MTIQQLAKWGIVPTWDLGLVVFLFIVTLFYEIGSGKSRFLLAILSTYFSFVIVDVFPFWDKLGNVFGLKEFFYFQILFFLGFVMLFLFLLSGSIIGSFFSFQKRKIGQFLQTFFFSILQAGLLVSLGLSFLPEGYYGNFSPMVLRVFSQGLPRFLWALMPIVALLILKRKKGRDGQRGSS